MGRYYKESANTHRGNPYREAAAWESLFDCEEAAEVWFDDTDYAEAIYQWLKKEASAKMKRLAGKENLSDDDDEALMDGFMASSYYKESVGTHSRGNHYREAAAWERIFDCEEAAEVWFDDTDYAEAIYQWLKKEASAKMKRLAGKENLSDDDDEALMDGFMASSYYKESANTHSRGNHYREAAAWERIFDCEDAAEFWFDDTDYAEAIYQWLKKEASAKMKRLACKENLSDEDDEALMDGFMASSYYKESANTYSRGNHYREADISKVKKFNTPYFEKLCYKVFEVMNAYEEETPEYDAYNSLYSILGYVGQYLNTNHETSWGLKGVRARLYRLVNDPVDYFGLSANNGAEGFSEEFFQSCYEEGIIPFIREYVTDPQLIEALDYVENTVVANIDVEKANKYNARLKAERDALQAKNAAEAAKRDEESKFLVDAAKKANVTIDEVEFFESISEWSVVLGTEDEDDANDFRNEVGEILGAENTLGASYDDIQGMADIHLGCLQYYEWSEMNGGDVYEDLREDLRDKYVVFACPKQDWVEYRRQNDW